MAIDFSVNNAQHLNQVRTAHDVGASANVGNFMGMAAVEVEDPMSLLADAAEELTFSVDTTEDFELQERNERDKAISTRADRVRLYQELMHEAGKARDIDHLKDELRSRKMQENVARHALELFHDPSDAWAALAEALEDFEKDPAVSKDVLDAIRTGMAELEKESGPAIHAGIQGALAAKVMPIWTMPTICVASIGKPSAISARSTTFLPMCMIPTATATLTRRWTFFSEP